MAKKATITPVTDTVNNAGAINTQLNAINNKLDNTLSLDGSTPNAMGADLDMNSNDLLNVGTLQTNDITVSGDSLTGVLASTGANKDAAAASAVDSAASATASSLSATQAAQYDGIWLDDVATLLADTTLTLTPGQPNTVVIGDYVRTRKEGLSYEVVASGGDVTTSGGVEMRRININQWDKPNHSVSGISRLVMKQLLSPNDSGGSVGFNAVEILGMGSSVGVGAGGGGAPLVKFGELFEAYFDKLGFGNVTLNNQSVNGDSVISGLADWPTISSVTSAKACLHIWGMNDASCPSFNAGQSFPGFFKSLASLCSKQIKDGITPILVTSPHRHTGRAGYAMANTSQSMTWPRSVAAPVDVETGLWPSASNSVVSITRNGLTFNADARHLMINEAIRAVAGLIPNVVLIDVEPYWFEAVGLYGEDALFDAGEIVHPNLFAHEQSYHRAFDDALRIASEGSGGEHFAGPQHTQILAGFDTSRTGQMLRDELLTDAPLSVLATSVFSNMFESYGLDRKIETWVTPSDGTASNPNLRYSKKVYTNDRANARTTVSDSRDIRSMAAAGTYSFEVPTTNAAGRVDIVAKTPTSNSYASRSYHFVKVGASITINEIGTGAKIGSATYVASATASGSNIVLTAQQNSTNIVFNIEYTAL